MPRGQHRLLAAALAALLAVGSLGCHAAEGASEVVAPRGPTVLTITGAVHSANGTASVQFDMATLSRFPQHSFITHTPWYPQARQFTGPLLRDVLAAAGASGKTLRAFALNDYRVDLPYDDVMRYDVVLARLIDGKPIAVRDKGPLFIIYPFDTNADLRNAVYYSRSAWQLKSIEVQ